MSPHRPWLLATTHRRQASGRWGSGHQQIVRERHRLRKSDQVTAGQHVRLDTQPVPGHLLLEGGGEEAVTGADRDPDRHSPATP